MTMIRAFINGDEGFAMCCWDAPSKADLEALFKKAGTPFERMLQVDERTPNAWKK
jgi:hypothetical protein